jgi:LysM repeat protein/lipoprotein-anchoring transpeptidase ErfK/SrfK
MKGPSFALCLPGGNQAKRQGMLFGAARSLPILVLCTVLSISVSAQTPLGKAAPLKRVEPGLEEAVKWEWRVAPSDEKDWGFPTPTPSPTPIPTPGPVISQPEIRPTLYEVKHGDALVLIGKKFGMTVSQIQAFNGLKGDKIRVGQTLKIPTLAELKAMVPPPAKPKAAGTPDSKLNPEAASDLDKLRLEIFLDREQFSAGPIVGYPSPDFARVVLVYQSTHNDAKDDASLQAKAQAAVPNVFAHYKLRAEDFRFIAPPRPDTIAPKPSPPASGHGRHPGKSPARSPVVATALPLTYQQLTEQSILAYRSPWEFVAERFHCQEAYLHSLNNKLPTTPGIGADFQVPNVVPFEIEKAFDEPLQPQADPKNPVTAAVIGLAQLNIYQSGALIAVLPLSPARPGLHGRNIWTILDVIPRPRLATFQKERVERTQKPGSPNGGTSQEPAAPAASNVLPSEQYLAAGPRNPVGILWINLAKSKSTDPLPYGLHGTSIPDKMNFEQSLGGFRLTNWDIARAVRHLPPGTPLEWK